MRVGVALDSTGDLDRATLEAYGLESAPVVVLVDGRELEAGPEADRAAFARLLAGTPVEKISTSGVNVEAWGEAVDRLRARGAGSVLLLSLASTLSGTHRSAVAAARLAEPFPVRVVDSGTASCGLAALALSAARLAASGASLEEVEGWVRKAAARTRTILASRDTSILRHLGRLLEAEPGGSPEYVLLDLGARIRPLGAAEGVEEAVERLAALLREHWQGGDGPEGGWQLVIGHGGNADAARRLEERLGQLAPAGQRFHVLRVDDGPIFTLLSRGPGGFGLGAAPLPGRLDEAGAARV
ncbi:MAG: DegV family EDD domain-containing protein [Clostridia bacterium]|nr:DegV family EDD domain-containing protein [Clostridia bacterium]